MLGLTAFLSFAQADLPPAPVIRDPFILFFESGSTTLNAEHRQLVENAWQAMKRCGASKVEIVGNADRAGGRASNLRLSRRRADTVAAWLVLKGHPAGSITVHARGEDVPLHSTGDGVPEAQNRYVTIMFC